MPNEEINVPPGGSGDGSSNTPNQVCAARIAKLPQFWREEPEIWFIQVESSFEIAGITQDATKYQYMLSNLDPSILFVVKDIILNPPHDAYAALKARIIKHFAESDEGQLKKLLGGLELGDEKPSHLLQKMKGLAGTRVSTEVLRTLFLDRLPEKTRCILAVADTTDLDKLANIADKICEQFTQSYSISELTSKQQPYISTRSVDSDIGSKLNVILSRIDALESRSRSQFHKREETPLTSRKRSKSRERKDSGLCWYHWRFSDKASKCIQPCNFDQQKN